MPELANAETGPEDVADYVRVATEAIGVRLDGPSLERVTEVFARNARMAALVMAFPLPDEQDPAALLRLE